MGRPFKSAEPVSLTEEGTEYHVVLIKHIFESHILLQFDCTNTVAEQVLENVSVQIDVGGSVGPSLSSVPYTAPTQFQLLGSLSKIIRARFSVLNQIALLARLGCHQAMSSYSCSGVHYKQPGQPVSAMTEPFSTALQSPSVTLFCVGRKPSLEPCQKRRKCFRSGNACNFKPHHVLCSFQVSDCRRRGVVGTGLGRDVLNGMQEDLVEELSIPLASMGYNTVGQTYVLLERVEGALAIADIVATLRFTVKEIDPSSGILLCCTTYLLHHASCLVRAWRCCKLYAMQITSLWNALTVLKMPLDDLRRI